KNRKKAVNTLEKEKNADPKIFFNVQKQAGSETGLFLRLIQALNSYAFLAYPPEKNHSLTAS
ncbi:MAG: hypothetical protein IIW08_06305, partial [Clostridia bacterium]|nr:hypothetical protein [Clostridia bacterium]